MEHINSTSYIAVLCSENANPKFNRLQLHTDPPSFIELRSGWNILTVEEYPDLKYGFSQIKELTDEEEIKRLEGIMSAKREGNCQEVLEVDLSHFDASEMTTMIDMFDWMRNIRKIELGAMRTPKLKTSNHAFSFVNSKSPIDVLDLSGLDFSSLIYTAGMFNGAKIGVLNLSGCDLSNVACAINMFEIAHIKELILDNANLNEEMLESIQYSYSNILKISLKGWKESNIRSFIRNLENYRNTFNKFSYLSMGRPVYVLDRSLDYKLYETENGMLDCQLIKRIKDSSKWFKTSGTVLERYLGDHSNIVAIPDGISHIANNAFEDCNRLEVIILPESIKSIGRYAFNGCTNLRLINIPSSVKEIEFGAFAGCDALKQLYLPDSIEKCESLENERLNYFRIPQHLWNEGLCASMRISHIVVGLNKNDLCINTEAISGGENGRGTISFETYEISCQDGQKIINTDGALLRCNDFGEDGEPIGEVTALSIDNSTLAVPTGVARISDHCFGKKRVFPIYIPETVEHISSNAIQMADGRWPILVTKKRNYTHLKSILPQGLDYIMIYVI